LDKAWEYQKPGAKYSTGELMSEEEKLQIMAWAYGFPTHAVGDIWAHTLVNEFADGPFPELGSVVNGLIIDPENRLATENALRHILIEGYIADATPGWDGEKLENGHRARELQPDGDISDQPGIEQTIDAPHLFIHDALIYDLPDLPASTSILYRIEPLPQNLESKDFSGHSKVLNKGSLPQEVAGELNGCNCKLLVT
jgi:hypothetical protein